MQGCAILKKNKGETGYEEAIYIRGGKNKCAAVKELFDKVFSEQGINDCCILDTGNFGFVILKWYNEKNGFGAVNTFAKANDMFGYLLEEWEIFRLYQYAKKEQLTEYDISEMIEKISGDHKRELEEAKHGLFRQYLASKKNSI